MYKFLIAISENEMVDFLRNLGYIVQVREGL
jgi:hypothetical protein